MCSSDLVHAQIEEELFYPVAKDAIKEPDLVNEANVEHASAKDLIAQIQESDPSDEMYDAKVKVLGEYIDQDVPAAAVRDLEYVFSSSVARRLVRTEQIDGSETRRVSSVAFQIEEPDRQARSANVREVPSDGVG